MSKKERWNLQMRMLGTRNVTAKKKPRAATHKKELFPRCCDGMKAAIILERNFVFMKFRLSASFLSEKVNKRKGYWKSLSNCVCPSALLNCPAAKNKRKCILYFSSSYYLV